MSAMDEDRDLTYRRWRAAEALGQDDEADAAFASVFQSSVGSPLPSSELTARTMAAVAAAATADARRARFVRTALLWAGVPAGLAAAYFGAGPLVSAISATLVALLNFSIAAVVWFASGPDIRSGFWSVLTGLGRAAGAFVSDPRVTFVMLACQGIAVLALAALHRLLGREREWLK
jgi:hypothetical protein